MASYIKSVFVFLISFYFFEAAVAQPANNNFSSATDITSLVNNCSANAAYTTVAATADGTKGSCWDTGPNNNVWFKFTATSTGYMKAQVKTGGSEGSLRYSYVALWDASLTQLSCQGRDYNSSIDNETDYLGLTAGQTYYISVDNYPGYAGSFTLCLSDEKDYNYYEGARDVTGLINGCSADAAYSTQFASGDRSKGSCWDTGPNSNRWFKFTATSTGYMKAQVKTGGSEGSLRYSYVAMWDASLTQLSCQGRDYNSSIDNETDYLGLTAGQTYYISVDNYPGYAGSFTLCLSDEKDYNCYEGARDVTSLINGCSADAAYSTQFASGDRSKGSCWDTGPNNNRWFKFTATSTGYMKAQVKTGGSEGSLRYSYVALWDASLTQLSCQGRDYNSSIDNETDYLGLTAGQTYYISVDNYPGYAGSFTLCLSDEKDYNYYEGARDVTSLINGCSADAAYSTQFASGDRSKGSCWDTGPNNNRWFKFTATSTGYMKVQVKTGGAQGTQRNSYVALWNASLTQLSCQNRINGTDIETDYLGLTAGQMYYISVDNYPGYSGSFTLCLSDVVDYNYFEGAKDVTTLINGCSADAAYSTQFASGDRSKGSCWDTGPNNNRWFKFTATSTGYMKVQVKTGGAQGTQRNSYIVLWNASLTQLSCQSRNTGTYNETDYLGLTEGQTYYISIDNYPGYSGSFTLCLSDVVDYNYFEGAKDVTTLINGCSADAAYSTQFASGDRSKGSCWDTGPTNNRWFKFTATSTGYMKVQVKTGGAQGTQRNSYVALWNASLTQLSCQSRNTGTYNETDYLGLTPGQTYYISVDNYPGYAGSFTLCLSDEKDYNYYEGAITISDLTDWCSENGEYSTLYATPDRNKGSCWSSGPNNNRWFKFTAIASTGVIQVKTGGTEGTLRYPYMALWAADGTTQLACTNASGATNDISLTYPSLTVGSTYYISVDNATNNSGTFTLCVNSINPNAFYSRASGSWNDVNTWSNAGYAGPAASSLPDVGDVVYIRDQAIMVTAPAFCARLNMTTDAANTSLTVDNTILQVHGRFVKTNNGDYSNITTVRNDGSLVIANNFELIRSGGNAVSRLYANSGSLVSVGQDVLVTSTAGTGALSEIIFDNSSTLSAGRDVKLNYSGGTKINFTFNNTTALFIGRDLTLTSTAPSSTELVFNGSASMRIKRNIVRGSTPYGSVTFNGASSLTFNGTSNQQFIPASIGAGGDGIAYRNVIINNTSGYDVDFMLNGIVTISGSLTLTRGVINTTASNYVVLVQGSSTTVGSTDSYIDGPVEAEVASAGSSILSFPIGTGNTYRPAKINVTHSTADPATYRAEHKNSSAQALGYTQPATIDNVSTNRYWIITRSGAANLTSATATLYYGIGSTDGVIDPGNLRIVKTNGAGTAWFDVGGTGSAAGSGTITSSSFTSFSTFALANASGGNNPLPVQLESFEARPVANTVELNWVTASELNNDFFTIERSADGVKFEAVTQVDGQGTISTKSTYQYVDREPYFGRSYYRLRQTDFDRKTTLSNVISVDIGLSEEQGIAVYPNPVTTESFTVRLTGFEPEERVFLKLSDWSGRQVHRDEITVDKSGHAEVYLSKAELAAGMYYVTAVQALSTRHLRFIVKQ